MKIKSKKLLNNYYTVLMVSIIVIIATLCFRNIYLKIQENQKNTSVFSNNKITQVNLDDIDYALSEVNEAILYVSYTGSTQINKMEKRLYKEIKKKDLVDKIIYLDVTDYKDNYVQILKNKFPDVKYEIESAPLFIYIKNNEAIYAISSELNLINYKVLNDMVSKYEIE